MSLPTSIPLVFTTRQAHVTLKSFPVYDPRLLPFLLMPEERIWKSHLGSTPVEYDITISNGVFGPGDVLKLSYKLLVNYHLALRGARVRRIHFALKEMHTVGEDRCCAQDDLRFESWYSLISISLIIFQET